MQCQSEILQQSHNTIKNKEPFNSSIVKKCSQNQSAEYQQTSATFRSEQTSFTYN